MSHLTTVRPRRRGAHHRRAPSPAGWSRSSGFPLGGFAALTLLGPVDSVGHALAGGLRHRRRARRRPGLGAALRPPPTGRLDRSPRRSAWPSGSPSAQLARRLRHRPRRPGVQGAVTGAGVGLAQAVAPAAPARRPRAGVAGLPRRRLGARAGRSPPGRGIAVDEQFTVFGASGAVTVAAAHLASCPSCPLARAERRSAHEPPRGLRHRPGRPPAGPASWSRSATTWSAVNRNGAGDVPRRPGRGRRRHRPARSRTEVCAGRGRRLLLPQRDELRALGRGVPAAAARRPRRAPRAPVPGSSCSTTSTPTARPHGRRLVETMAARPTSDQGRHPRRDDRGAARRARRAGRGRGRHRSRVGLLRARRDRAPRSATRSSAPR